MPWQTKSLHFSAFFKAVVRAYLIADDRGYQNLAWVWPLTRGDDLQDISWSASLEDLVVVVLLVVVVVVVVVVGGGCDVLTFQVWMGVAVTILVTLIHLSICLIRTTRTWQSWPFLLDTTIWFQSACTWPRTWCGRCKHSSWNPTRACITKTRSPRVKSVALVYVKTWGKWILFCQTRLGPWHKTRCALKLAMWMAKPTVTGRIVSTPLMKMMMAWWVGVLGWWVTPATASKDSHLGVFACPWVPWRSFQPKKRNQS